MPSNPLKTDRTQLATIRRELLRVVREGWKVLELRLRKLIESNSYGLVVNDVPDYSADKLKRFRSWLRTQMDSTLAGDALIGKYIEQGFDKGLLRSTVSVGNVSKTALAKILKSKRPTIEKVKMLASRTFAEMEDVNTRTATKMSRILVDGLIQGKTVDQVAKEMDLETDIGANRAKLVARTELTRAHAEGQLTAIEDSGQDRVTAQIEFKTDDTPCPECAKLDGKLFTIEEARGVIPVHPNCGCVWSIPLGKKK